jgi:hypothetical protein
MSFAKIAEARTVKKIVIYLRQQAKDTSGVHGPIAHAYYFDAAADLIEDGAWKDVKLPKPKPRKKQRPR